MGCFEILAKVMKLIFGVGDFIYLICNVKAFFVYREFFFCVGVVME